MAEIKYPQKTRLVRIYRQKTVNWRNESSKGQYLEKHYIHPIKDALRAYVRQIVANNQDNQDAIIPSDRYLVVINWRDLPDGRYFVEWGDKTLKVLTVDGYEWNRGEIKLTCQLTTDTDSSLYKKISGEEWK